jgi:CMP/dCMP kinase
LRACFSGSATQKEDTYMRFTIAIDGPAAAGKGTIAREISRELALAYLDTGLLFRITSARVAEGQSPIEAAQSITLDDFERDGLRTPEISQEASRVSALPEVRQALTAFQKEFAYRDGGAVLDGRDIGTSICPDADLKLFLTASPEARARRRHAELTAQGYSDSFDEVLEEMRIRDERDSTRDVSPMRPTEGSIILDTSEVTADEAVQIALEHAYRALGAVLRCAA